MNNLTERYPMAERAKDTGPEWNGLGTVPVSRVFDTSRSTPGDQFHFRSPSNSDQPSDFLISSRDTDLALSESETLMALIGQSDGYEIADERWESDRHRLEKWSIAAKMTIIGLVSFAIAIAVFFENNEPSADATRQQIVVPKQTATETVPAVARKSGETLLASAEQNRPRDPTYGLISGLPPVDAAAGKTVGQGQESSTSSAGCHTESG